MIKRDMMATECTQESVLDFLLENGGRVKNKELVAHFKVFLSCENTKRAVLKERFKRFVDNIAYVKQENGEKVVCLKKKYRFPEMRSGHAQEEEEVEERDEELRRGVSALRLEEAEAGTGTGERQEEVCVSDIALVERDTSCPPPRGLSEEQEHHGDPDSSARSPHGPEVAVGRASGAAPVLSGRRRTSRGSQRSLLGSGEDGAPDGPPEDGSTPRGSRKNFIELMMSSSPQVRRSLLSGRSVSVDEDCASVTLDPLEHEWMMSAADGEWLILQRLLDCDPALVCKRDFVTGFTCLHWAAKQGKQELLARLVEFGRRHGVPVDVNVRSSAGYTPLHLAAMHSRPEVMKLLVGAYDADVELRDHSGRKAAQYLRAGVSGDIKDIIGACGSSDTENAPGAGRWKLPRVLQSNLNALRLLNHPEEPRALHRRSSIGRLRLQRSRFRTQIVHSTSFRENEEVDISLKSPGRSRPVSNLFG